MTDINLAAIRARDTVTMETLPELERLAMTMEDEEMRAAILLVTDRRALLSAYDALAAENAALRKDAERYRFIRDNHEVRGSAMEIVYGMNGSDWDAAIDAALAKERP